MDSPSERTKGMDVAGIPKAIVENFLKPKRRIRFWYMPDRAFMTMPETTID
jgi:hypothetical protein